MPLTRKQRAQMTKDHEAALRWQQQRKAERAVNRLSFRPYRSDYYKRPHWFDKHRYGTVYSRHAVHHLLTVYHALYEVVAPLSSLGASVRCVIAGTTKHWPCSAMIHPYGNVLVTGLEVRPQETTAARRGLLIGVAIASSAPPHARNGTASAALVEFASARTLRYVPWKGDAPAGWTTSGGGPLTRRHDADCTDLIVPLVQNWLLDIHIPGPMN